MLKPFAYFIRAAIAMMVWGWIVFVGSFKGLAGDYVFRTLEVDDGLPVSTVTDVAQTPEGYLWVGTLLGGLARYDGARFVNFDALNTPEFKNASVRRLCLDNGGALWIATYGALVRWQHGVFHLEMDRDSKVETFLFSDARQVVFVTTDHRILAGVKKAGDGFEWNVLTPPGANPASQFCADHDGRIWYRHKDGSLWQVRDGQAARVETAGLIGKLATLVAAPNGRIWAGTDRGIFGWDGTRFQNGSPTNGEAKLAVRRMTCCRDNSVWVEANGRLRCLRDRNWIAEAKVPGADLRMGAQMQFSQADGEGGLWLVSSDMGLRHVAADGTLNRLGGTENLPGSLVKCLFVDRERNLWVGYERRGLVKIRKRLFQVIGRPEGLGDSVVSSLCEGADGSLWMGTVGGTLSRWKDGLCTNLSLPQLGSRCQFAVVNADAQGRIWAGTTGNGLLVSDGGEFRHVVQPDDLKTDVRLLLPTRDGKVWLAGQSTLYCFANGELTKIHEAQTSTESFAALAEAPDGTLWVGTFGGELLNYDGKVFRSFRPPSDVPAARLWALCTETNGTLWIGTSGNGLLRFREGAFKYIAASNGLPAEAISQVLDDGIGGLWLGTRSGISRVSKDELERCGRGELPIVACRSFGRSDGLRTVGCALEFQPMCVRACDGRLWFAMANGVAGVRPGELTLKPSAPPVLIEAVLLDGQNILPPAEATLAGDKTGLKIPPGRHDLEFRYTGISFASPEGVRFRFQLEGLDKGWQSAGANRSAVYRYLPPGEYTFRVSACNSGGVWNEAVPVGIILTPFLWQRAWFPWVTVTAVATLITAGLVIWLRARHRRRLAALQQLQAIEKERLRIARDLHDDVGASLAQISNLGELASRRAEQPEALREHLDRLKEKSRETLQTLDQIVWTVNPRNDALSRSTSYFTHTARDLLEGSGIRCRLRVPDELPSLQLTSRLRHHLLLVIKEAVRNILKHSDADEMLLTIATDGRILTVTIADNGHGFDLKAVNLERNGLENMPRRLEEVGGGFHLQTAPGQGTTITITVPLVPEHS